MIDSTNPRIIADNIRKLLAKINAIVPGTVVTGNPSGTGFNTLLTKIKIGDNKYKLPAEVTANPEGEATESLTKLGIGSGIYSVDTNTDYSTEAIVGKWVNGKDLYRKVFIKDSGITSGNDISIAHGISDIDDICMYSGYGFINHGLYVNYSDAGYYVECHEVTRSSTNWKIGSDILSQISKLIVVIYYTKQN